MAELTKSENEMPDQPGETWATRWGLMLRLARQVAGLSLSEVAERSGLSKGYLSKLESAHPSAANPSRATLAALARALPSTIPLIQKLDAEAGLPTPKSLLRAPQQEAVSYRGGLAEAAEPLSAALVEGSTEGLPTSWTEWEVLLALLVLESSGLGPPTMPVLARACGVETLSEEALAHLGHLGLLRPLPPARPGWPVRYTQGPAKLETFGIQRPADIFIRAASSLLLHTGKNEKA
jgi:transcriptional regulator with XRE-family HTH domain